MSRTLLAIVLLAPFLPAQEIPLVRRVQGREEARGVLRSSPRAVSGEMVSERFVVRGRYELSPTGMVERYRREVRTREPDGLVSRVELAVEDFAYVLREETPLGSRRLTIEKDKVSLIVDGEWPEGMLPVVLDIDAGYLRVLLLARHDVDTVGIFPREAGARYVDLPGGGITVEVDGERRFRRMILPGDAGVEVIRAGVEPDPSRGRLPPGVAEEEFTLRSGEAGLAGVLALPSPAKEPVPGVVLLADAGPRDRDGDRGPAGSGLLRDLAHDLARQGYASVRWDKRGSHASTGPDEGLRGLVEDARAAGEMLARRPEVDRERIAVVGHGEGGIVALEAARDRPDLFRAIATLGAPARPLGAALEARLRARLSADGEPEEHVVEQVAALRREVEELRGLGADEDPGPGRRLLRDLVGLDPITAYKAQKRPVLILYGREDARVPQAHRSLLRSAMAFGGTAPYEFQELQLADHEFLKIDRSTRGPAVDRDADVARPRHPGVFLFLRDHLERAFAEAADKR